MTAPHSQNRKDDNQSDAIAFLEDPASYGLTLPVERIETHSALVFLVGETAIKIKRDVRYDYLDFSTLTQRKAVLERELALNKPAAPMIYERITAITRDERGALSFDGQGEVIEYALVMRRFPKQAELSHVAASGKLDRTLAEDLGHAIATYHAAAPERSVDGSELIAHVLDELSVNLPPLCAPLDATGVAHFLNAARQNFHDVRQTLKSRAKSGRVRRCHGDLHLGNLVVIDGRPVPFDALEFDETLATCDVAYDFAFLLMDLWHRGLKPQANAAFNAYLNATQDYDALRPLPLFLAMRAAIRAMVAIQKVRATPAQDAAGSAEVSDAKALIAEASNWLARQSATAVAIGGPSGTGKTTAARGLAPHVSGPPGAVHLRSDVIRKRLAGVPADERLPKQAYTKAASDAVYAQMFDEAAHVLAAGHSVILDAAFLDQWERAEATKRAADANVPFVGIWLTGDLEKLKQRVRERRADASDATADVVEEQFARGFGPIDWTIVDATGDPNDVLSSVLRATDQNR